MAAVEVLEVLEFSSARKRMSVVVQEPGTGRIRLLSKGADATANFHMYQEPKIEYNKID